MRAPLALTMGDPAGIGGEITLATWLRRKQTDVPPFFTVDDPKRLDELARRLNLEVPITVIGKAQESLAAFRDALPVLPLALPCAPEPGKPNSGNAAATLASIEAAYESVMRGEAAAMVTNPIAKSVLYEAGFKHPGHTEFLATLAGVQRPVMMLASELLRVVPVTIHVSLRDAIAALTTKDIVDTAVITANGLQQDFGLSHPRLAVAGLNPHAGESGAMGDEDDRIVRPAVEALKAMGIEARGPLPPDTMFHAGARATYDAAICMYHDQALIPIKTLDFDRGVNVTLGLPIIRTSPDHGTAFDIAGRGIASPESLIAALHMAAAMAHHRALHRVQLGAQV